MFISIFQKLSVLIVGLLLLLPIDTQAQDLPQGVTIHQLDNGIQVLLIENPALPMVGVNVVVKVGSAYETFATSGMSHMLEHLLFNGTTNRTQKELYDDVDRIGGYNNANTSEYFTNYMMVTPAENIRKGMDLQADMLFRSVLPEKKFAKEKGIVLEEISKSLADANEQAERNVISLLFKGHALSLPTLGTYATIEAMDRDQVFEFYKNNYVPNNMLMSVVGNFRSADMLKMVNKIYGAEAPAEVRREINPQWAVGFAGIPQNATAAGKAYHRFYSGKAKQLQLYFPIPENKSSAFYELLDIKLKENNKIIEQALQSRFGDSIESSALQTRISPVSAFLTVRINLKNEISTTELSVFVKNEFVKCKWNFSDNLLKSEVSKAHTAFLKNIEKPHMFGIYNAYEFALNGIEGVLASYGSETYLQAGKDLETFAINSNPILIFQHPEAQEQDTEVDKSNPPQLFPAFDGSANLIVRQNSASPLLAMHFIIKHKAPLETKYGKDAAKILHDTFGERLKSDANQKISGSFGLSVKVNDNPFLPMDNRYMHPDYGYIRIEALGDDIPAVIQFINSQMLNFTPTAEEYAQAAAKTGRANPMMMGGGDKAKKLFKKTYQNLVYEENPYKEQKKIPSYEQLLEFAKTYFVPSNMIISVVSPTEPEKIKELYSAFTSAAETDHSPVYTERIRIQHKPHQVEKEGNGNRSYLYWGFSKEIDDADKPALQVLSLLLRDKIVFDIREKQGMAYNIGAGIKFKENRASFYINQGTRPQNVDVLVPQYPGFFNMSILTDFSEAELEKSLNMYLGRMMFRRLSSINQGFYLGHSYYFHQDINYDGNFLNQLKNVTLADVKKAAQKYMVIENPVSVIVR